MSIESDKNPSRLNLRVRTPLSISLQVSLDRMLVLTAFKKGKNQFQRVEKKRKTEKRRRTHFRESLSVSVRKSELVQSADPTTSLRVHLK